MILVLLSFVHLGCHLGTVRLSKRHCPQHLISIWKVQGLFAEITSYFAVTLGAACCVLARRSPEPSLYERALTPTLFAFQLSIQAIHIVIGLTSPPMPPDLAMGYPSFDRIWHSILFACNSVLYWEFQVDNKAPYNEVDVLGPCGLNWGLPGKSLDPWAGSYSGAGLYGMIVSPFIVIAYAHRRKSEHALPVCGTDSGAGFSLPMATPKQTPCSINGKVLHRLSTAMLWESTVTLPRLVMVIVTHGLVGSYGVGVGACIWVAPPILAIIYIGLRRCRGVRCCSLPKAIRNWENRVKNKLALEYDIASVNALVILSLLGWVSDDAIRQLLTMRTMRDDLQRIRQNNDTQGEWGVGQVAAVVAWLPLLPHLGKIGYAHFTSLTMGMHPIRVPEKTCLSMSTLANDMDNPSCGKDKVLTARAGCGIQAP